MNNEEFIPVGGRRGSDNEEQISGNASSHAVRFQVVKSGDRDISNV